MKLRLLIGLVAIPVLVKAEPILLPVNIGNLTCRKDEWINFEGRKIYWALSKYTYNHEYLVFSRTFHKQLERDQACISIQSIIEKANENGGSLMLNIHDYVYDSGCIPNSSEWGVPAGGSYRELTSVSEIEFPFNLKASSSGSSRRENYSSADCSR